MKKRRNLILFHIPVWAVAIFVAWFFSSDSFPGMRSSYVVFSTLIFSFWMLCTFYLFYSWLVPKYLAEGKWRLFWLYGILFVVIIMPVSCIALLLLTKTSALRLEEFLSLEGVLPYLGSVIVTLACSGLGALYHLLLKR
jgi:hypothetical protein